MPILGSRLWRPPWLACLGLLLLLAAAVALWRHGAALAAWQRAGLWVGLAVLAPAVLYRLSGRPLFGPILFYDLVRSARHGRHALLRCIYLAALLLMLFLLYLNWSGSRSATPEPIWSGRTMPPNELARFGEAFFETFVAVQFVVLVLVTPGCTAGAIAEEKERRTLDYLLASDLSPSEIVLGKLVSRLTYLVLLLLTGLPVLGLLQLLGGVDPQLVLAAFTATGLTVLSLAGLSIFNSVFTARPRTAIILTYVQAGVYVGLSSLLHALAGGVGLVRLLSAGNILTALDQLRAAQAASAVAALTIPIGGTGTTAAGTGTTAAGAGVAAVLPGLLRNYALFHGAVLAVCLLASTVGLRAWSRWQASRRSRRSFAITFMPRRRPRVRNRPMLWKELHAEPMFRFGRTTMAVVGAFLYGLLILGGFGLLILFIAGLTLDKLTEFMNDGMVWIGTPVACVMLLGVAVRAASCFSAERDRQTLDSLLSSPLSNDAILRAKWLGSLLCVRRLGWYLGAIWLAGVLTGGLHPVALPLLLVAWFVYAAFLASLGMVFSLWCRSTTRATLWTLVTVVFLSGGYWLCGLCCNPVTMAVAPVAQQLESPAWAPDSPVWILEFQKYGLTPPLSLGLLAFDVNEFSSRRGDYTYRRGEYYESPSEGYSGVTCGRLMAVLFGLGCYAMAAWALWAIAVERFGSATGRSPGRPDLVRQGPARSAQLPHGSPRAVNVPEKGWGPES